MCDMNIKFSLKIDRPGCDLKPFNLHRRTINPLNLNLNYKVGINSIRNVSLEKRVVHYPQIGSNLRDEMLNRASITLI